MSDRGFDSLAGIHYRNLAESNPSSYGNGLLLHELGELGVGAVLIPNKAAYGDDASSVVAHAARIVRNSEGIDVAYDDPDTYEIGKSAGGVDVVRARLLTPTQLEERIPVLNGPKLRRIGASKWRQYELAEEFMPETVAFTRDMAFKSRNIASLTTEQVVVKADMSQDGNFLYLVNRLDTEAAISEMRREFHKLEEAKGKPRSNERILVQEFAPGEPLVELRAQGEDGDRKLANAEQSELRIYCFVDAAHEIADEYRYYATARVFKDKDSDWVHIDQESVPEIVWNRAAVVADRVLKDAGVRGGYFAIDMFKSKGQYMVREINTRDPMLVDTDESFVEALKQRKLLANLIATLSR